MVVVRVAYGPDHGCGETNSQRMGSHPYRAQGIPCGAAQFALVQSDFRYSQECPQDRAETGPPSRARTAR